MTSPASGFEAPRSGPATFQQRRMWFAARAGLHAAEASNVTRAVYVRGELRLDCLERAIQAVVDRHDALRSSLREIDGDVVQVIASHAYVPFSVEQAVLPCGEEEQQDAIRREQTTPFDLGNGPLLRVRVLRLLPDEYLLIRTVHHIVFDGWSEALFNRECAALYDAYAGGRVSATLPDLPMRFADFARWQRDAARPGQEQALAYWRRQLAGVASEGGITRGRAVERPAVCRVHRSTIAPDIASALERLSRERGATLFMTLLAGFAVLVAKHTGDREVVIGTPVANRLHPDVQHLIGLFVNALPLRVDADPGRRFDELLDRVRRTTLDALRHQEVVFEQLGDELPPDGLHQRRPLFDIMFALQNTPARPFSLPGVDVVAKLNDWSPVRFALAAHVQDEGQGLAISWAHAPASVPRRTLEALALEYDHILRTVAFDCTRRLSALAFAGERQPLQALTAGKPRIALDRDAYLHRLVAEHAAARPDAVAVVSDNRHLSYAGLERYAGAFAHVISANGAGPECRVGLYVRRDLEMVIAALATLKAGASYVPLEPRWPHERLRGVCADAAPSLVVVDRALAGRWPRTDVPVVVLDRGACTASREAGARSLSPGTARTPEQAAYVLYTSGSTGQPKGVVVSHRATVGYLASVDHEAPAQLARDVAVVQPLGVDSSVTLLWGGLCYGGTVHVVPEAVTVDAHAMADYMTQHAIDVLKIAPSHLMALQRGSQAPGACLPRACLIVGGEASGCGWLTELQRLRPECAIFNHYGPTETTVGVLMHRFAPDDAEESTSMAPLGHALANSAVYVLDEGLASVPPDTPGDLYIGGQGVARGYLNRPTWTAERFVADPWGGPGARMFRSGDRARRRADGLLEFLGRSDQQVKLHGHRVELGEIETAVRSVAGVDQTVVLLRHDAARAPRLLAYVLAAPGVELDPQRVRTRLSQLLPAHMVPGAVIVLDAWPRTEHGKIDRRGLPEPASSPHDAAAAAPRTPTETLVCALVAEVLGVPRVGIDDNFFALGGDSVSAIQLSGRFHKVGLRVTTDDLFREPTLAAVAAVSTPVRTVQEPDGALAVATSPPNVLRLQARGGDVRRFSQSVVLVVPDSLREDGLVKAIQALIERHDALRLRLVRSAGRWQVSFDPPGTSDAAACVRPVTLDGASGERLHRRLAAYAYWAARRLDPERGRLLQATWLRRSCAAAGHLLLTIHHLAIDGLSWSVLIADLKAAYDAAAADAGSGLAPHNAFQRWVTRLEQHSREAVRVRELPFWIDVSSQPIGVLGDVELEPASDNVRSARHLVRTLPAHVSAPLLNRLPGIFHGRPEEILLVGLALAIIQWERQSRGRRECVVLVDAERHGREDIGAALDPSRVVGWLAATSPVRFDAEAIDLEDAWRGGPALGPLLKTFKEQIRAAPNTGIGYGLLRYTNETTATALSGLPAAPVKFNYLGRSIPAGIGDWQVDHRYGVSTHLDPEAPLAYPIAVNSALMPEGGSFVLQSTWSWASRHFSTADIRALAAIWHQTLETLVEYAEQPGASGRTRSDVPLLSLSQAEIERLENEYS